MAPNGEVFLLNPDAPNDGPMRYAHARVSPATAHKTIYIAGIAAVAPDGTYEGVKEQPDGTYVLDIKEQTAAVLKRIDSIIKGASNGEGDIHNIIDAVVYILDMKTQ